MTQRYKVTVVPHTHWDRAWYVPFEEFRTRLVRLTDKLIAILERDPEFKKFVFDGQTVVLEDYLQIRPHMRDRLANLVKSGRLEVGPWYILPDEFIVSGESLVRTLMLGHSISKEFGKTMKVGYVPDPFGHIGQMPQILEGFGIDNFIFTRGIEGDKSRLKNEFLWEAPDGTKVLALWQRHNYGNASWLGCVMTEPIAARIDMRAALEKIRLAADGLTPHAVTSNILLNNGVDHMEPQPQLPRIVDRANREFPDLKLRIGSFQDFVNGVKSELGRKRLDKVRGELIYSFGDMLHGVYSARMYIKQRNEHCQRLLERYAEPLSALSWLTGSGPYVQDLLWYAWRELLKNHPHDDICGCSVDRVHQDMVNRFDAVDQVGTVVARDAVREIARNVEVKKGAGVPVVAFNPLWFARTELTKATIHLDPEQENWDSIVIRDSSGKEVPHEIVNDEEVFWWEVLKGFKRRAVDVVFTARDVPPFGITTYYVSQGVPKKRAKKYTATRDSFENGFYRLRIERNGTLALYDKKTRSHYSELLIVEDCEDAGDEYNYSPAPKGRRLTSAGARARTRLVRQGIDFAVFQVKLTIRVPASLSDDRKRRSAKLVPISVVHEITCSASSPRIDISTTLENTARDHRLRVLFLTDIKSRTAHVDEHFDVVGRKVALPKPKAGVPPYPTKHQKTFVDLSNGKKGFCVINDGLPEYEIIDEGTQGMLALTLLRSVGWLSRGDLITRHGNAGPSLESPEGQCLGTQTFRYAILAHPGDWRRAQLVEHAHAHNTPIIFSRADILDGAKGARKGRREHIPEQTSFVTLTPTTLVLSAVKKAERRNMLVVRFYNPTGREVAAQLEAFKPIKRAELLNLNEEKIRAVRPTKGGTLKLSCGPKKIVTVGLVF